MNREKKKMLFGRISRALCAVVPGRTSSGTKGILEATLLILSQCIAASLEQRKMQLTPFETRKNILLFAGVPSKNGGYEKGR